MCGCGRATTVVWVRASPKFQIEWGGASLTCSFLGAGGCSVGASIVWVVPICWVIRLIWFCRTWMASKEGAVYFLVASLGVFDGVDDVRKWGGTLRHAGMTVLVTDLLSIAAVKGVSL